MLCQEEMEEDHRVQARERADAEALVLKVPFLGRVPLDPLMVLSGDDGRPFVDTYSASPVTTAFTEIADTWKKKLGSE
jgi:hypothetical protein